MIFDKETLQIGQILTSKAYRLTRIIKSNDKDEIIYS